MKKSIILVLFTCICFCGLEAQSLQMQMIGMTLNDLPREECYTMNFEYICPTGNCILSITNDIDIIKANSGAANYNWMPFSGTICFEREEKTYNGLITCKVAEITEFTAREVSVKDGCVVVVEGG